MRSGFLSMIPNLTVLSLLWETVFLLHHSNLSSDNKRPPEGEVKLHSRERHNPHSQAVCIHKYSAATTKAHIQNHWHTTHLQGLLMILKYLCHLINAAIHSH